MRNNLEHLNEEHASRAAVAQGLKLDENLKVEEEAPKKCGRRCAKKAEKPAKEEAPKTTRKPRAKKA